VCELESEHNVFSNAWRLVTREQSKTSEFTRNCHKSQGTAVACVVLIYHVRAKCILAHFISLYYTDLFQKHDLWNHC